MASFEVELASFEVVAENIAPKSRANSIKTWRVSAHTAGKTGVDRALTNIFQTESDTRHHKLLKFMKNNRNRQTKSEQNKSRLRDSV